MCFLTVQQCADYSKRSTESSTDRPNLLDEESGSGQWPQRHRCIAQAGSSFLPPHEPTRHGSDCPTGERPAPTPDTPALILEQARSERTNAFLLEHSFFPSDGRLLVIPLLHPRRAQRSAAFGGDKTGTPHGRRGLLSLPRPP